MKFIQIDDIELNDAGKYGEIVIVDPSLSYLINYPKHKIDILESHMDDPIEYEKVIAYVGEAAFRIRKSIRKWLRKNYSLNLNDKQCGYIYNIFLLDCIFSAYVKYKKLVQLDLSDSEFSVPYTNVVPFHDYGYSLGDTYKNAYMYGLILEKLGAKNIGKPLTPTVDFGSLIYRYFSRELKEILKRMFRKDVRWRMKLAYVHGYFATLYRFPSKIDANSILIRTFLPRKMEKNFAKRSNGKIAYMEALHFRYYDYTSIREEDIDMSARREMMKDFQAKDLFEGILVEALVNTMPLSLCENFIYKYRKFYKLTRNYNAKKIYSAANHDGFFAAAMSKKGAKILDIQHSGLYGTSRACGSIEYMTYDEFLTWGWEEKIQGVSVRPVAPTRFHSVKSPRLNENISRILLITNSNFCFDRINALYSTDYINKHFALVRGLDKKLRKKLVVRIRTDFYGIEEIYKKEFPEVQIEKPNECSLEASIAKSELVISDNLSSPYYEGLMSGKPTLLYEGISYKPYYDRMLTWLKRLGKEDMYWEHGGDLAVFLNENIDTIYSRWLSGGYEDTKNSFLAYFMGTNKDYEKIWENEFLR